MADIPTNAEAETIVTLENVNKDIDSQILALAKTQASNSIIIENLRPNSEWTSTEQFIAENIQTKEVI